MKTFCYVCGLIEDINYPQGDITNHTISFLECGSRSSNGSACNMAEVFPGGEKRNAHTHTHKWEAKKMSERTMRSNFPFVQKTKFVEVGTGFLGREWGVRGREVQDSKTHTHTHRQDTHMQLAYCQRTRHD